MGSTGKGLTLDDFLLGPANEILVGCPMGKTPISAEHPRDRFITKFNKFDCQECDALKKVPRI